MKSDSFYGHSLQNLFSVHKTEKNQKEKNAYTACVVP